MDGFSLHGGVATQAHERDKLERVCRYITRPAVSARRLSLTATGTIRYCLKTPYRDGTTHVMLLRASCPPPFGPASGCSKSLPAILSSHWILCTGCTVCRGRRKRRSGLVTPGSTSAKTPCKLNSLPRRIRLKRLLLVPPNSKHRALVTPAKRGKGSIQKEKHISEEKSPAQRRAAMTWGQRLKRVLNIDIETCTECGGQLKVIASIRPHGRGR